MVRSPCKSCGEVLNHGVDDVPPSGMVVRCPKCATSVTVIPPGAAELKAATDDILDLNDADMVEIGSSVAPVAAKTSSGLDLPAPVGRSQSAGLPAPVARRGIPDLPAPVAKKSMPDLPAPVAKKSMPDLPAPVAKKSMPDLPAPVAPRGVTDLPAPVSGMGLLDLPAPVSELDPKSIGGACDLPAPVHAGMSISDLPAPVSTSGVSGLPASVGLADNTSTGHLEAGDPEILDLNTMKAASDPFAPPAPVAKAPMMGLGAEIDLGSPAGGDPLGGGLDLGSPAGGDPLGGGLDLGGQGAGDPLGGGLDLGSSGADDPLGGGLDALDLESPSAGGGMGLDLPESQSVAQSGDVVSFSKPSGKAPPPKQTRLSKKIASNDDSLDLDDAPLEGPAIKAKPAVGGEATEQATGAKRASRSANKKSAKFQKIGAAVLGVAILGVGGYLGSQLIADEKQKEEVVGKQGSSAQKHLTSDDPGHWQEAIVAAKQMQEADAKSVEAVAIQAEAHYAAALDRGTGVENHQKQAVTAIRSMRKLSGKSSHSALAEGLHALTNSQYDEAIKTLSSAAKKNKKNPNAPLYLGWAQAQKGDYTKAVIAFDACLALSPKRIPALYAKAEALLNAGKHDEAKESFLEVTAVDKDHLGALLGIARLATVSDFGGRENRYTELLGRPDIAKQDPRTVSKATSLAADEARKAGRLAVASERYTEALKVDPGNLEAVVGQAAISVAKDNIDDAAERLDRVLALTPTHSAATMLLIEVSMMQGDHEKAATSLANLIGREPPIEHEPTLARMELLRGRLLGADLQPMLAKLKDLEASITPAKGGESDAGASPELLALRTEVESAIKSVEKAFQESIKLEGGGGVSATLQLASFYAQVGRADEGVAVLVPLREQSKSDASLAVSLGVAYMAVKNHTEAIVLFRDALRQKPTDTEARFQLGRALAEDKQPDEAITELKTAYEGSEKREDIGLELAEIYHNLGRSKDAVELYKSVLEGPAPSLNAKAKAGRYFVRVEEYDKAAAIGEALLKENPRDPAGLFLTGEKLFQDEKYSKARDKFAKASKADPVGQYFDALGRANQAMQSLSKAMRAFERAIQVEPSYLDPYIGLASVRVARREYFVALETLAKAVKVEPENALIHYLIGQCHLEMRDIDTAVSSFERAAQYDPHPGMAYFGLGQAHDANGKPKDAAAAFDKATKLEMERVAESPSAKEGPWVSEAYRKLGYAIRESSGSRKAQYEAWLSYRERVEIESDASEEVDKLLIPLSNKYK